MRRGVLAVALHYDRYREEASSDKMKFVWVNQKIANLHLASVALKRGFSAIHKLTSDSTGFWRNPAALARFWPT